VGILLILPFFLLLERFNLLALLATKLQPFHVFCLNRVQKGESSALVGRLICSEPLHNGPWQEFLTRSGLYHCAILGSFHLHGLIRHKIGWRWKNEPAKFIWQILCWTALTLLLAMGQFSATLFRPLLSFSLGSFSRRLKWNWAPPTLFALSVLISLCLRPTWLTQMSFVHSTGCGGAYLLARGFSGQQTSRRTIFQRAVLLSLPLLWGWANLHPLSLFLGIFLGEILTVTWSIGCACVWIFPFAQPVWDSLLLAFRQGLNRILDPIPALHGSQAADLQFLWTLTACYWILAYLLNRQPKSVETRPTSKGLVQA